VKEPPATIIIVDDDPSVRRSLRRLLGAAGYRVSVFASADDFLAAGEPTRPACFVIDVRMPGRTGFDLYEILMARGTDVPVIFISGHDDPATEIRALKAGAVRFLAKPMDADVLLDAVDHAIRLDRKRVVEASGGAKDSSRS
jgi:FixJ family two-component response regulator